MSGPVRPEVLVGYDGSPASAAAVALAADEATARRAPMTVVHVLDGPMRAPTDRCAPEWDDLRTVWGWRLDAAARPAQVAHRDLDVRTELRVGDATAVLLERSREACLLVIGRRRWYAGLLASVATRVLEGAAVPVLVHRPTHRPEEDAVHRPVLVGVEAAGGAEPALAFGFLEASLRRAPLAALHLWSRPAHAQPAALPADGYGFTAARAEEQRMLAEALAGWSSKYPDVPVTREVRHSLDPAVTLAEASRHAQLVVVGATTGRHAGFAVPGSVGQTLLDHAGCPIAVVPERPGPVAP
jgi:nucleotide-binding universal stress UspA family protein